MWRLLSGLGFFGGRKTFAPCSNASAGGIAFAGNRTSGMRMRDNILLASINPKGMKFADGAGNL